MNNRMLELSTKKMSWFRVTVISVLVAASFCLLEANAQEIPVSNPATPPLLPKQVVAKLIQAAQNNDLDRVLATADFTTIAKGYHGRLPLNLISTLRDIDLKKTRYSGVTQPSNPLKTEQKVIVHDSRYSIDFDLELRTGIRVKKGDKYVELPPHYVVVSVHP